jgi:hypothetical protein
LPAQFKTSSSPKRRDAARDVVERAKAFIETLRYKIAHLQGVENDIAKRRAASFREALCEDTDPQLTPSAELQRTQAQRMDHENQLVAAIDALRQLETDLAEANTKLTACVNLVTHSAKVIVAKHADELADKLREAEHEDVFSSSAASRRK